MHNKRLYLVAYVFSAVFLLFVFRLISIQIFKHKEYKALALDQHWSLQDLPAKRGDIITSDGYVIAGTQNHYLLYAQPKLVEDPDFVSEKLAELVAGFRFDPDAEGQLEEDLFNYYHSKFNQSITSDLLWVALEHNISPYEKEVIEQMSIDGVGFEEEPVRYYSEDRLASHVLGFVASNEYGEKQGYFGVEGMFNEELKGKPGRVLQEQDATGTPILLGEYKKSDSVSGRDVILSINRSLQYLVEKALKEGVDKYDAVSGSVILMDPRTGDVLALANYPNYLPSDFLSIEEPLEESPHRMNIQRTNLAISQTYEPGSVIKGLTVATAIDLGEVTPGTTFDDSGPKNYSDYTIDNWDGKHYGIQTVVELLQKSNNIGAAWVGHQVGVSKIYEYFTSFGMGTLTGIELEGEDTGYMRDPDIWTDIDLATISFGQGVSATPLQVLNAFNALANGGSLMRPRIVQQIIDDQKEIAIPVKKVRNVISQETSDTMTEMLTEAVSGGEAKYFVLKNYQIAGKTGTAQIPVDGTYHPDKTNATFVGYMTNSRKFSMIVKLEEPKASIYAAETAVPLWMDIAEDLIKYFGIPPDSQ